MSRVGVVGDLHAPAVHPGYLAFCSDVFEAWRVDRVVFIGDVADWHRVSRHVKAAGTLGADGEYADALKVVQQWYARFPSADITEGNHDKRIIRAAWDAEVPETMLRTYNEVWETPRWRWHVADKAFVEIDDVHYTHGTTASGMMPALGLAKLLGRSAAIGHFHKWGGVNWLCRPDCRRFGLDVGCGIDDLHPAMRYGMEYASKCVLGCGVVIDGLPYHEIMPCSTGERYHRSRFKGARR